MTPPWEVPADLVIPEPDGAFVDAVRADPDALVYLLLNVGDGDTQLVLLPQRPGRPGRRALVIDVATTRKLPALIDELEREGLIDAGVAAAGGPDGDGGAAHPPAGTGARLPTFPIVIGTHPHDDHIGGVPELLRRYRARIGEYWEPGYFHPSAAYVETMVALEDAGDDIGHSQPTSGLTRFVDGARLTVLTPGIGIRNRFDSYGTDINNASIAVKIEYPAARVVEHPDRQDPRHRNRRYLQLDDPWSLILGADAQTTAWAQVEVDFPELHRGERSALYTELRAAGGRDHLKGHVFKLPHHASKHGLNLELVERVQPMLSLVSSVGGGGRYGFPHDLAVAATRDALRTARGRGTDGLADHDLGLHYTAAVTRRPGRDGADPLGSIAVVVPARRGADLQVWRFGDDRRAHVDVRRAVRMARVRAPTGRPRTPVPPPAEPAPA